MVNKGIYLTTTLLIIVVNKKLNWKKEFGLKMKVKIFEAFAGYGTASFALNKIPEIEKELMGFSEVDKYAIECFTINHGSTNYGDITKIDPNDLPDFNLLTAGVPCFVAGTLILSTRGLLPIEEIQIGDIVLTHKNRWRKVINTTINSRNHYYKVKFNGSPELKVTGNHKIYSRKMIRVWNKKTRTTNREWSQPEWISIEQMREDDFVGFGTWSNKYSSNEKKLTKEECWLIGRYVADGYIINNKRKDKKNSYNNIVSFCVGKEKQKEFLKIAKKSSYHICISEDRTVFKNKITNNRFMNLCLDCGKGAENKKIPHWIINLPTTLLSEFLKGYMSGDGSEKEGIYQATSISKILIYQLGQIVHRLYKIPYTIYLYERPKTTIIENRIVNQKDTWTIRFSKIKHKQDNSVWIDKNLWGRYVHKEKIKEKILTYNIEVEEDNSYVANNIIVKNCQSWSQAGQRGGFDDPRGNMWWEFTRILNAKQPKYFLAENVKGLLSHDKGESFAKIIQKIIECGYDVDFRLLDTKELGVPQSRQRVWILGKRKDTEYLCNDINKIQTDLKPIEKRTRDLLSKKGIVLYRSPLQDVENEELKIFIKDILEENVPEKYYLSEKMQERFRKYLEEKNEKNEKIMYDAKTKIGYDKYSMCLRSGEGSGNKPIIVTGLQNHQSIKTDGISNCLPSVMGDGGGHIPMICAMRGRNPKSRVAGLPTEQQLELREDGCSNTLTIVQKDNIVYDCHRANEIREYEKVSRTLNQAMGMGGNNVPVTQDKIIAVQLDSSGKGHKSQQDRMYDINGVMCCLPNANPNNKINIVDDRKMNSNMSKREVGFKEVCPCLTARDYKDPKVVSGRLRRLMPKECFRLQGFLEDEINFNYVDKQYFYKDKGNNIKAWKQNVKLNVATESQKPISLENTVLCTIKGLKELELLKNNAEHLSKIKNVCIVIKRLELLDVKACVINTTKCSDYTEMLYTQIKEKTGLNEMDMLVELTEGLDIKSLWRISWGENSSEEKLYITSILINWMIQKKIYSYVKTESNIIISIMNCNLSEQNFLNLELSNLRMDTIKQISDTNLYKLAGNGQSLNVVTKIFQKLFGVK
jgi:DNA-cytosine methyltransferase